MSVTLSPSAPSFVLCAIFFLAVAARAQDNGRVRAELSAALDGRAVALTLNAELREYAALFQAEEKPKAKARLDGLDRSKLSAADLRELSEAYVLLGYFDAGASAGRALQDREPSGTQGLKLAAFAKLEEKDYAASAALAREALKINPEDRDAAGLLHSAEGRGAASGSARVASHQEPPPPAEQTLPGQRAPVIFTARVKGGVGTAIPFPEEAASEDGMISRGVKWMKLTIKQKREAAIEKGFKRVDRALKLRPGEEKLAWAGAGHGIPYGIGAGAIIGLGGGTVGCAMATPLGVPYLPCVAAIGVGFALAFIPVGAFAGGAAPVIYNRTMSGVNEIYGHSKDEPSEAE